MKSFLAEFTATHERRVTLALLMLMAVVFVPLAGNYGMWDPWETHYGEVARQMLERSDYVSQWWPGSPLDKAEFWSKPVLTFWIMAIGMRIFGIEGAQARPDELTTSWTVEWATRLPLIILSIVAVWSVYLLVRRLVNARAGALAAVVLATSTQWALITRQAMTDMAFVAPMTIALALAGLALLLPEEEREMELPRGTLTMGRLTLSFPRVAAFYWFVALFVLTTLPQLVIISIQVKWRIPIGKQAFTIAGVVPMLLYFAVFLGSLVAAMQTRNKRQLYLLSGYVLCALASLGKGPAGVALPAIVLVLYMTVSGRFWEILTKLEIPRGAFIFIATAFPWYHAMLIRHGAGFWNEFIGDNYVHRAGGRHGDRGNFDYYAQWIGYAMFPWSGIVAVASLFSFQWLKKADSRRGLVGFALVWLLSEFALMTIVGTKFHHYILPALPAAAILVGVFLDELAKTASKLPGATLAVLGTLVTLACGRDLAAFPPRLLWLFNYDYVNMPGTGRPWPTTALYGDRYEYGPQIWIFAGAAALATLAIGLFSIWRGGQTHAAPAPDRRWPAWTLFAALVATGVTVMYAISLGPDLPVSTAPTIGRLDWIGPTMLMLPFLLLIPALLPSGTADRTGASWTFWASLGLSAIHALALASRMSARHAATETGEPRWLLWVLLLLPVVLVAPLVLSHNRRALMPWVLGFVAVAWTGFVVDKLLIELSPHWSQKHVVASYYAKRKGPDEPLLVWQLYWRGENFYTRNAIYKSTDPAEKTVFLGDKNSEKMQAWFTAHPGKKVYFIVERVRYETLRGLLPQTARASLTIEDQSNNKLYLASAQL